jgi:hypothetical protein
MWCRGVGWVVPCGSKDFNTINFVVMQSKKNKYSVILCNLRKWLPKDTALYPIKLESSRALLGEPQIINWLLYSSALFKSLTMKPLYMPYVWCIEWLCIIYGIGCSRTVLIYLFLGFALISYGRFVAVRYKFILSTYVQEPLVIGTRGCVQTEI